MADYSLLEREQAQPDERIVMFDLDSTLIDSGKARNDAWDRALGVVNRAHILNCNFDDAKKAYKAIYDCHEDLTRRIGTNGTEFGDMRQQWNDRMSYALLIAWDKRNRIPKSKDDAYFKEALLDLIHKQWNSFSEEVEEIADDWSIEYKIVIDEAMDVFWKGDWKKYLYPGVPDLLRQLTNKAIRYLIVTEGHVPTQWQKICQVDLDKVDPELKRPLVEPAQLLCTSQAARPLNEMRAVASLIQWYKGSAAAGVAAAKILGNDPARRMQVQVNANANEMIASGLQRITDLFRRLGLKFQPGGPDFYVRVLYAINAGISDPRKGLMSANFSWDARRRFRLAMVGDNPKNDIQPVLSLSEKLKTKIMPVWISGQGKYGGSSSPVNGCLECRDIITAGKEYLLNDNAWTQFSDVIALDEPPPLFTSVIRDSLLDNFAEAEQILELLVTVAAVQSGLDDRGQDAPDSDDVRKVQLFVDDLMKHIVADLAASETSKEAAVEIAIQVCMDRESALLARFRELPKVAVRFVLSLLEHDVTDGGRRLEAQCIRQLATLLTSDLDRWASAVVEVIAHAKVFERICKLPDLCELYETKLSSLVRNPPNDFPEATAVEMFEALRRANARRANEKEVPPDASPQ